MDVDVIVEIPKGSRNKYAMDFHLGRIRLNRTLFTATQYPADYRYIEAHWDGTTILWTRLSSWGRRRSPAV